MLEPGTEAPEFTLRDHNGDPVSLADFTGQRVVLYFYPEANTRGCTIEAHGFRDTYPRFTERDAQVLGVSNDPVEAIAAFKTEHDLPFPLLSDPEGTVAEAYESYGTVEIQGEHKEIAFRNTYVIGPDGRIERAYEGVDPDGHADRVLGDLTA